MPDSDRRATSALLPPGRRKLATVLRWVSLPLAAACLLGPLWLFWYVHQQDAGMVPVAAVVVESDHVGAGRRFGFLYELRVSFTVNGHDHERRMEAWSIRGIDVGDPIQILVDPATAEIDDESTLPLWIVAVFGVLAALFFVTVTFVGTGRLLRMDRQSRDGR